MTPGGGSGATWAADEDTALSALATLTLRRLRIEMSNEGGLTASGVQFRLEVSGALSTASPGSCEATSYLPLPTADWEIFDSTYLTDGTATTDVTDGLFNENTAFVAGQVKDAGNQTTGITLTSADFTEIEFALRAKATATPGALYCFRLTNAGSTTDFKDPYPKYAQATIAGVDNFSVEAAGGGAIGTQVEENPFSIQVTARDYLNATVTSFTGTVEITATGGTLSDGGGTTASFSSGLLASHSVTIADPGSVTITATATATGTSNSFTVNALTSYLFRKEITIDRSKIPSGCGTTLPNFPLLFSVTHTDLIRDTDCATGVDGPCDAQGDDIIFRALDTVTCGGAEKCTLDHEIESYDGTTGTVVAWVRLPAVKTDSHTEDTKIYVYYGNSNVTSSTENVDGVWDVNYVGVWHLNESGSGTVGEFVDSSGTTNHGQGQGGVPTQDLNGQISNAQDFDGTLNYIKIPYDVTLAPANFTISMWRKADVVEQSATFKSAAGDGYNSGYALYGDGTNINFRWGTGSASDNAGLLSGTQTVWTYTTATYDGSTMDFYLDGGATSGQDTTPVFGYSGTTDAQIGIANGLEEFDGLIDEVRISNTPRNACSIGADYNNQKWPDKDDFPTDGFFTLGVEEPGPLTAVELIDVRATAYDRAVLVEWRTGYEIDNLGFHVYREVGGERIQLTPALIAGSGLLAERGMAVATEQAYAWWDEGANRTTPGGDLLARGCGPGWHEHVARAGHAGRRGPPDRRRAAGAGRRGARGE